MNWLRFLMLLALVVWIGGIIFFAFVVAPSLFAVLPTPELAGRVVSRDLSVVHWMGLISGAVFLLCSIAYNQIKHANARLFSSAHWLIISMLVLTAISQFGIIPRMHGIRAARTNGQNDSAQVEFQTLHRISVWIEGGVLVLGLVSVALISRRFGD